MDEKSRETLEYFKIINLLEEYCQFPASAKLAQELLPTSNLDEARRLLAETSEARELLSLNPHLSIGGARDVRESVDLAERAGVLDPVELLDIKFTLIAARNLRRKLERQETQFPLLAGLGLLIPEPVGVIDSITRALSDRGEVLDSASSKLGQIRREMKIIHDRLLLRLEKMVADPNTAQYLQEALVTLRDGRYVLPLRAEFKGKIKSIIHDQSASGATLFVEPLTVVDQNNKYRELHLDERAEERRILAELSEIVARHAFDIIHTVEMVAAVDLVFAKAKFSDHIDSSAPFLNSIRQPKQPDSHLIKLINARHPLLDPDTVVPIDVELNPENFALVITGPNTGGKTVTLKTVGLLCLMAQSGLHIPVNQGSELSVFENVFADIGDEQSIEQSLSTFSGHISNIIRILEHADERCLVILDELGAGTDPQEGAALARSLLTHLLKFRITTLVTTHHPELKKFAHGTEGVVNASVEFDLKSLRPTYHLTIGLPGRSNALAIAERLGLPAEIIDNARTELRPEDLQVDDLLDEIHNQRDLAREARTAAEQARRDSEVLRSKLAERLDHIEDERLEILEAARSDAEKQVMELQTEIADLRRDLARARQPLEIIEEIESSADEMELSVKEPVHRTVQPIGMNKTRAIRLGDRVRLRTLGTEGVLTALGEEEAEIQVGVMRVRARLADVEPASYIDSEGTKHHVPDPAGIQAIFSDQTDQTSSATISDGRPASPGMELDLRGQRADDAVDTLERYLERAYLSGLPYVRIIHGKGTGRLRNVVRTELKSIPYVKSFESGEQKEGGEGVTVVLFTPED